MAWFKLMEWVCQIVHVLELPPQVAFRTAVWLGPLLQHYLVTAAQQHRKMAPLQLITAALVYMASSIGGYSEDISHNTNKGRSSPSPTSMISLENLAFCVDNRWTANVIFQVVTALLLAHSGGGNDKKKKNPEDPVSLPAVTPIVYATPTVENWIEVFTRTTCPPNEDADAVNALAQDLAFFLLPSALYLVMIPRRLAASLVVTARWTVLLGTDRGRNNIDHDATASINDPRLDDPHWVFKNLWSPPLLSTSLSTSWPEDIAPFLPRVLETLHNQYHHTQNVGPQPLVVMTRRRQRRPHRQFLANQDDDEEVVSASHQMVMESNDNIGLEAAAALLWKLPSQYRRSSLISG